MPSPLPEIPADLHPACVPLAFLLGRWRGDGYGEYPTVRRFPFRQEIEFTHHGKPYLAYASRSWLLDDDGRPGRALAAETGYWRPTPDRGVEVVLAHPTGYAEVWYGDVKGAKVELGTDVVARTATAKEYTAGHRMYGVVEGALLWAFDMAAVGQQLQTHLWARLHPVDPGR